MTGMHGLSWTEFYILITDRLTDGRTLVLVKSLSRLKNSRKLTIALHPITIIYLLLRDRFREKADEQNYGLLFKPVSEQNIDAVSIGIDTCYYSEISAL